MEFNQKMRHLITSALPYVNGVKHLGNLVGSILPADCYARFLRQQGKEVLYICATDDHGTPAELGAKSENISPQEYCSKHFETQKNIYKGFDIAFDHFGQTSRQQNIELTQQIGKEIYDNGFAEIRTIKQLYSNADKRFLPDRYVTGECPHCGYDRARGDQCENCTKVLDPTDLVNPFSSISGSHDLEVRETSHLFLLQSKLVDKLKNWIDSKKDWPNLVRSIAYKWLEEGLQDRCITRDLEWGVPVKNIPNLENKVYYVWFDAPIGYISATKEWSDLDTKNRDYKNWWYNVDDVILTQFMAKDNIPFHTLSFPATLMATNKPWKKVDYIKGFNWLTFYGGKFSTSQKRGVFTDKALEILPADYWRYYLISRAPESSDSSFTWEDLQALVNKDLADVLGNFVNRILKFTAKKFGHIVPESIDWTEEEKWLVDNLKILITEYTQNLDKNEFRKASFNLRQIWALGNEYVTKSAPWTIYKESKEKAATILSVSINLIRIFAIISSPIIPATSLKLAQSLKLNEEIEKIWIDSSNLLQELKQLPPNHPFEDIEPLFNKITDEQIEEFKVKFGSGDEDESGQFSSTMAAIKNQESK